MGSCPKHLKFKAGPVVQVPCKSRPHTRGIADGQLDGPQIGGRLDTAEAPQRFGGAICDMKSDTASISAGLYGLTTFTISALELPRLPSRIAMTSRSR